MPNRREAYEGASCLVPGCSLLGWLSLSEARGAGLGPHHHAESWELCLIARGEVEWWVEDEVWDVGAHRVYLTRPFERHGGIDAVLQPCELFWAVFRFDGRARLAGLERADIEMLASRFAAMRERSFPADAALIDAFARLRDAHRQPPDGVPRLEARLAFTQVLIRALRCHDNAAAHPRAISPAIRRAIRWMEAHLGEDFALDDAAKVAGLSVTRFHERFVAEVAMPPGEWRTRQRIRAAKKLLRYSPQTVTQIAMRCGFTTSQYFATVFRKITGCSPRAYRAAAGATLGVTANPSVD